MENIESKKKIEVIKGADYTTEFNEIKPRIYKRIGFSRDFFVGEKWFVIGGTAKVIEIINKIEFIPDPGSEIPLIKDDKANLKILKDSSMYSGKIEIIKNLILFQFKGKKYNDISVPKGQDANLKIGDIKIKGTIELMERVNCIIFQPDTIENISFIENSNAKLKLGKGIKVIEGTVKLIDKPNKIVINPDNDGLIKIPGGSESEITIGESLIAAKGKVRIIEISNHLFSLDQGDVITFQKNAKIRLSTGVNGFEVKQIFTGKSKNLDVKANVMINYAIIKLILEILNKYETFTNIPYESDLVFDWAKEGNIFKNAESYNLIEKIIKNWSDVSGISEDILYGKKRLYTGLKCNIELVERQQKQLAKIKSIDTITTKFIEEVANTVGLLDELIEDPIGMEEIDDEIDGTYSLKNLLSIIIRKLKNDGELPENVGNIETLKWMKLKGNTEYSIELKRIILGLAWAYEYKQNNKK